MCPGSTSGVGTAAGAGAGVAAGTCAGSEGVNIERIDICRHYKNGTRSQSPHKTKTKIPATVATGVTGGVGAITGAA